MKNQQHPKNQENHQNKRCNKCNLVYDISYFRKNSDAKDGLSNVCKSCASIQNKKYYENNKEIILKKEKVYRKNQFNKIQKRRKAYSEANKDKISEYHKNYYSKNKKYFKLRNESYYKTNKEKVRLLVRSYAKKNPDKVKIYSENKRSRKFGSRDRVSLDEWNAILNRFGHKCLCCGKEGIKLTQDHVIPLTLGGRHSIDNIQPLCTSCNSRKHTQIVDYRIGK